MLLKTSVALAAVSAFVSSVTAQTTFQITSPNANTWWVAEEQNVFAWDCKSSIAMANPIFTVQINNTNLEVLASNEAIIASQQNDACSQIITNQQANLPASTGYQLFFTNNTNAFQVIAISEIFEIKATGSAYAPSTSSSGPSSTSSTSASTTASQKSAATSISVQAASILGAIAVSFIALNL